MQIYIYAYIYINTCTGKIEARSSTTSKPKPKPKTTADLVRESAHRRMVNGTDVYMRMCTLFHQYVLIYIYIFIIVRILLHHQYALIFIYIYNKHILLSFCLLSL